MTHRLRKLLRTTCVALGATSLYLLWLLSPLITQTHDAVYHWSGPPSELFLPPAFDFCAFWLLLTLGLTLSRASGRMRQALWCGMIAFTPWITLKNWSYVSGIKLNHAVSLTLLGMALVAFLLFVVVWRPQFEEDLEQLVGLASTLFLLLAMGGVVILCEVACFGWQARSLNAELTLHHAVHGEPTHAGRPRIIWILFDELSYEQVYNRRFPGLQLPSFEALAAQATVFTQTIPAGIWTEQILPSLMTGKAVDSIRSAPDGRQLYLHNSSTSAWEQFNEHDTVFQDALNLNYSTAVAGWYNPYCRILPDVLDRCFWTFSDAARNTMIPQATFESNVMKPLMHVVGGGLGYHFASLFPQIPRIDELNAKQHIRDYVALADAADGILDDHSAEFVLIHLPVPHPLGIYNRKTDGFATQHSSYLDNLRLADKLLGHIRSKLEQSNQWNASTVIVMGDHSWRTKLLWIDSPEWTKEEQAASQDGRFDERPVYLAKMPDQRTGVRINAPFAALDTRRLLDALLSQEVRSAEDLSGWVKHTRR